MIGWSHFMICHDMSWHIMINDTICHEKITIMSWNVTKHNHTIWVKDLLTYWPVSTVVSLFGIQCYNYAFGKLEVFKNAEFPILFWNTRLQHSKCQSVLLSPALANEVFTLTAKWSHAVTPQVMSVRRSFGQKYWQGGHGRSVNAQAFSLQTAILTGTYLFACILEFLQIN